MWMNMETHILAEFDTFSLSKPGSYRGGEQ